MGILPFAVVLSTMALASALPKLPGGTPRQQQAVFEYFPDFRYPDEMVNPAFMTAKCMSEGVFPHPYKCTWFYRCHDRLGFGFFHTSYFICEPGTEFDDELDQCIPKSGTCGDEDLIICETLASSCRSSNGQQLCEYQECYRGGRDAGIQRLCEQGQLHNGQTCIKSSGPVVSSPPGECPLNKLRPRAKWTDQASSGCSEYSGCRAGKNYQETLCSSYYDCPLGVKIQRFCPEGYLFSHQWELCIQPPQVTCEAPPPPAPRCYPSRGQGDTCQQYSGCRDGGTTEITQTLCSYYTCQSTGSKKFSCPRADQIFDPNTKTCQKTLSTCQVECFPENAVKWESCSLKSGCRLPSIERSSELLCQEYSCSDRNSLQPCAPGQIFNVSSKSCVADLQPCPPPPPPPRCTASTAQYWGGCFTESGCTPNGQETTVEECQNFRCTVSGQEYTCLNGQVFSPTRQACVDPITADNCPCTVDRAQFWGGCVAVTGCSADNQIEKTARQCQTYSCSLSGSDFKCDFGQVFNPESKSCISPLSADNCPCTVDRAQFWGGCVAVTGCSANNQIEQTARQCQTYSCSLTGSDLKCDFGQVFNPESKTCVSPLSADNCPCTVDRAQYWGGCVAVTGCSANNQIEQTARQCQTYSCSVTGSDFKCDFGQVFNPESKTCVSPLSADNCPCTVDRAQFWGDCVAVTGCSANNQIEQTARQCQTYSCSLTGEDFSCDFGRVFNPDSKSCMSPLSPDSCPCTINRAQFGGDCVDVTGCTSDSPIPQTVNECQHYSCSNRGLDVACPGAQVFSSDQRSCVEPLTECPRIPEPLTCTPANAKSWDKCTTYCDNNGPSKELCYFYSCSERSTEQSERKKCLDNELFDPELKICTPKLDKYFCARSAPTKTRETCKPNKANWWYKCSTIKACVADRYPQQQQNLCGRYSCEENGAEQFCGNGQMFDIEKSSCVTPLTGTHCFDGISLQHHQVTFNTWNYHWKGVNSSVESHIPTLKRLVDSLQTIHHNSTLKKV